MAFWKKSKRLLMVAGVVSTVAVSMLAVSGCDRQNDVTVINCSSRKIFFYHMGLSKDFPYLSAYHALIHVLW